MMSADIAKHGSLSRICGPGAGFANLQAGLVMLTVASSAAASEVDTLYLNVDGASVKVQYVEDVFYAPPITHVDPETGESSQIEPFPLTSGMMVLRRDGESLDEDHNNIAIQAAQYYCDKHHPKTTAKIDTAQELNTKQNGFLIGCNP